MAKGNAGQNEKEKKPKRAKAAKPGGQKREDIDKMRELLSRARDNTSIFTQGLSKRLEFSNLSLRVYDRHRILINDIFLNQNINTFISYNDKSLHSWNPETMEVIRQINFAADEKGSGGAVQSISCLCYSLKYKLYFACSKDHKLIVFNEHLNKVRCGGCQAMPVGLVEHISFWDHRDANDYTGGQLIVGGKEGCFIIDLEIRFQYAPAMAIMLDPKGQSIGVEIRRPKAIKAGSTGFTDSNAAEDDGRRTKTQGRGGPPKRWLQAPTEAEKQEFKQALARFILDRQTKGAEAGYPAPSMETYTAVIPFLSTVNKKWTGDVKLNSKWPAHKGYIDTLRDALANPASLKELVDAAVGAGQVHFDADRGVNLLGGAEKTGEAQLPGSQSVEVTAGQGASLTGFDEVNNDPNGNLPANWDQHPSPAGQQSYGSHIKQLQGVGRWVKGLKIFEQQGLIVAWKKEYSSSNGGSKEPGLQDEPALVKLGKIKCTRDQILFYSLRQEGQYQQGEVWSRYYDSSIKEDFITDLLVFKEQKFFVTAHNFGDIHLRKLVEFKNIDVDGVDKEQVKDPNSGGGTKSRHIFKGHSRRVTSLAPIESKATYFVSASLDGKLRIWCIEKMIELYCFDISVDSPVQNSAMADSIMNVKLINHKIYAMIFKSAIEIGLISHLASSYYISKQPIRCLGKCFKTNEQRERNSPYALFISFDDDSIVLLNPLEPDVILSTIYPPPTSNQVVKAFYCTSIQRMFLLLKTGSICVYHVEKETGTLEQLKESKSLKDYEGKPMTQGVTCLDTCYTRPPQYDCEIFSDLHKYQEPAPGDADYEFVGTPEELENDLLDTFLVVGLSKGTVIFVRVNNLDHIYARFSIHRQAITQIHEVKERKIFLSICEELHLMIWGFTGKPGQREQRENPLILHQKFDLGREVFTVVVSKANQLLLCFKGGDAAEPAQAQAAKSLEGQRNASKKAEQFIKGGDSEILVWDDDEKELKKIRVDKSDEHEVPITCCDTLPSAGLFVSGDQEGLVKIWDCRKRLIREIKFVEPVNSVSFLNPEADIIVGHSGNLSRLDAVDYMARGMTAKRYGEDAVIKPDIIEIEEIKEIKEENQEEAASTEVVVAEVPEAGPRAKNQESFADFLARAEAVDKDFKFRTTDDCKGNPDGDEQFFDAFGTKQFYCPLGHMLEEQKVSIVGKTLYPCAVCKEIIEQDYYYCKTDNEVYHQQCVDVEMFENNGSTISQFKAQAKGYEAVDEQQASGSGTVISPKPIMPAKATQQKESISPVKKTRDIKQKTSSLGITQTAASGTKSHFPAQQPPARASIVTQPAPYATAVPISAPVTLDNAYDANLSQSNTGSQNNSVQKAAEFKQQLVELKNDCVRIPSVPESFMKNRKRLQNREKQIKLMNSSTRRMMTENRIAGNIKKRNCPVEANKFHDILVTHSASHGNISMGFGQQARAVTAHLGASRQVSRGNQMTRSSLFQGSVGLQKDAQVGQGANVLIQGNSHTSEGTSFHKGVDQSKEVHTALKMMANSTNTFSIFDNNSFDTKGLQINKLSSATKNPILSSFKNHGSPSSNYVILKEQHDDAQKAGSVNEALSRQAVLANKMHAQDSQHRITEVRKSDELSLKTINQNLNDSQRGENAVTENIESPLKQNIYASTLQRSQLSKLRDGDSPDTALMQQKVAVNGFADNERRDASKMDASSNDNSPFYTMNNQNARLEQERQNRQQPAKDEKQGEKEAAKLSISLHPKPEELSMNGSQVLMGLDREEKEGMQADQEANHNQGITQHKNGQQLTTGKLQLAHAAPMSPIPDAEHEEEHPRGFKNSSSRFFVVQKVKQQTSQPTQSMPMTSADFNSQHQLVPELPDGQAAQTPHSFAKQVVHKEFSAAIRGSDRVQKSSEFVSTRMQQRAGQMQALQPHLITNAKMKGGVAEYWTTYGKKGARGGQQQESMSPMAQDYGEGELGLVKIPQHPDWGPEHEYVASPKISRQAKRAAATLGGRVELRVTTSQESKSQGARTNKYSSLNRQEAEKAPGSHLYDSQQLMSQRTGALSNHYPADEAFVGSRNKLRGQKSSEHSPQNFDHQSMAGSLLQNPDQLPNLPAYQPHATRQGAAMTVAQPQAGQPIYIQSMIPNGVHMPSKGLFNHPMRGSRHDLQARKPKTAGAYGGRRARGLQHRSVPYAQATAANSSAQGQPHPFSGKTRLASGMPPVLFAGPATASSRAAFGTQHFKSNVNQYKRKMDSIALIGDMAQGRGPQRRNESAHHQARRSPLRAGAGQLCDLQLPQQQLNGGSPTLTLSPEYQNSQNMPPNMHYLTQKRL